MDKSLLGLKIKQLRSEYGVKRGKKFTQKDLADNLGMSRSYLGDIESGRTIPNDEVVEKISKFFNVSVTYLTTGTVERFPGELDKLDEEIKALYPKIKKLSTKDKQKILDILKEIE